ncbi:MAG: hypothetical protein CVV21_08665 [Candidatus Goldiibacteriota bacterium HGW-Goldbacteria-1]|jgi:uncharacterized protein HemY|nr:MAG: hypothetical protein CVV21_08665 [Candidatus Goldiibacteriota bacterium HGW-Goldbacteria-1]
MTDYITDIEKEITYIKPCEEDDSAIEEAGQNAYMSGDYKTAELKFKELALAQPDHHAGCECLAMLYAKTGQAEKAVWFQERALVIARKFLEDDSIDIEVIEEMEDNLGKIKNGLEIIPWWKI